MIPAYISKKCLFLSLVLLAGCHFLLGQNNGRISGKVIDSLEKTPIDFATISIFKVGASRPFNGMSTDPQGNFVLNNLPLGEYRLTVEFIGYRTRSIEHLRIDDTINNISLRNIELSPRQAQLKGVTITAQAPSVQNKIDKMVYNPSNDLTLQGGVALDVLKKVPMISVDVDGNVELMGSANIRFSNKWETVKYIWS
jgi:ferric enterobactin receptor